jgi:hypothetical protein
MHQETAEFRKSKALAFFTQRAEMRKQVRRFRGSESGLRSCSHGSQNGFVAAGSQVNLLDSGASLGHDLEDVLHATSGDLEQPLRSTTLRFSEATRRSARRTSPSFTDAANGLIMSWGVVLRA